MAHNRRCFFEALDRSETRRDGGFKHNWSFSLSGDSEEERRHDESVVSVEEMDRQQPTSPDEKKSPSLRHFTPSDPLRTYENRSNNHTRPLSKLAPKRLSEVPLSVATSSPIPNRTNYFIISPAPSQGIVLQGRHFQHAQMPSAIRKPVQRNDFSTTQQAVEVDSIVLTCPEIPEEENLNIKRRVQQKRKPLEDCCSFPLQVKATEPLRPTLYQTVCVKCNKPSDDGVGSKCQNCGNGAALLPCQQATLSSPTPRPPIRSQPSPGPNSLQQNFYKPVTTMRAPRGETLPIRIVSTRGTGLPLNNGRSPLLAGTSGCCGARNPPKGKRAAAARQHELNDPIILSSDDEEDADNASTGSVNRLDSVSPRPADSAHSSPAPSGGRVEAAVKSAGEQEELNMEFFEDVNMKITIPRRARMKDQFGNQPPPEQFSPRAKKPKVVSKCDSIILECRSVRVGTLRRMVTKPVVFSIDSIQLETEGPERNTMEKVCFQASELISCEWCSVRKLPVLFFQTTPEECVRLRTQLNMSTETGGQWYDCAGDQSDEKYIVLIFENGLAMKEQMILEDILGEIGRNNNLSNFPAKLPFEEANIRLVNYNKASKQKEEKEKPIQTPPKISHVSPVSKVPQVGPVSPVSVPVRTRMATRQQTSTYFEEDEEDMTDLQPTFSGPIIKLMVYPPPPAKGGISVTNEDLHCLNDGEFLNDVIIDFYLKYLVLEKLKKEDAQRIHVFSSFFYKRLNQRERRNVPDTTNLPIQKRKHNRVKTWTRHVDLFQKDFIFVPINESAHWYLAVICFPGLKGPMYEQNPLGPFPASTSAEEPPSEENIPDHCRPLSPDRDGLDSSSDDPSSGAPEASAEGQTDGEPAKETAALTAGRTEASSGPAAVGNGQTDGQQYTSELHRISVCYGSKRDEDTSGFSDDQSSTQVLSLPLSVTQPPRLSVDGLNEAQCPDCLQDECSEDGTEDAPGSDPSALASKQNLCRQPCILIMDSLRGPARSTVVKTLREYLEVEWEVRKATQRSFGKDVMKGSSPRVPQQDNYSDCGVYILQYVESFFENPIPSFHLPVNLSDWFPQQRMKTKREEIKELILKIQEQQEPDRKEPDRVEAPPSSPEEPEIEETSGSTGRPPHLPISP
ncbi:sentrin-specific protease 6 isoform X2 [Dicentrarchus labrax]|uniref:SUMO specific peptidase 6 n=1 Tax=Dicentrarchus labrax TaxID=13489 RepID=A0A8P4K2F5_DICLA|nr:sentrin-specific protease 6 isoform X2 [Dicentrarchus labrax]